MNATNSTQPVYTTTALFKIWFSISYTIVVMLIFLIIGIFLILISCILRNKYPVKSRGCTHIFLLLFVMLMSMWPLAVFLDDKSLCIASYFTVLPLATLTGLLFLTRTSRFVLILSISKIQYLLFGKNANFVELLHTNNNKEENSKVFQYFETTQQIVQNKRQLSTLRCLQCCSSTLCTFLIWIIGFVCCMIIAAIIGATSIVLDAPNRCFTYALSYAAGFAIFISIIWGLLLLFDICSNIKLLLRCKFSAFFFEQDLYLYRLEYVLTIILLSVFMIAFLLNNFVSPVRTFILVDFPFISSAWYLLYALIAYFIFGGFIILVTLFSHLLTKYCYSKSNTKDELMKTMVQSRMSGDLQEGIIELIMEDATISQLFLQFCVQEWSTENFYCFQDLTLYKHSISRSDDFSRKQKVVQTIIDKYLKFGAPMELNISSATTSKLNPLLSQGLHTTNEQEWNDSLQAVLNEVNMNLQDTFSRFILSKAFKLYFERTMEQKK